ncbi:MAG: HD domain-containing protein [Proteobacteria bacterium]|nr:HD domain-containing protein [Pseudomonadota bacterium]MBU1738624.1 HD domain-containing protein [Pseudomonadota bacterium]
MTDRILDRNWLKGYPRFLLRAFIMLGREWPHIFITGGAVRDWLLGRKAGDLDLTIDGDAVAAARFFAAATGGAFVPLDEGEGVARVVCGGITVDFASFREKTTDILSDLSCRDFTINAMATPLDVVSGTLTEPPVVIDPLGGANDLARKVVRAPGAGVFESDPLRILRAFRFAAVNNFTVEPSTLDWLTAKKDLLRIPAPERIRYELDLIMASERGGATFGDMDAAGLLTLLFPELASGRGMAQPLSHHQDVFEHNLATLSHVERVMAAPGRYYPEQRKLLEGYLDQPDIRLALKWAALFHDVGKPDTCDLKEDNRLTFYNHDQVGAGIWLAIGRRLCWGRRFIDRVALLIRHHMYPFHLNNSLATTGITPRACLKLAKTAGKDLSGLFLLAMGDSMAAKGPNKPAGMEENLARLFSRVDLEYHRSVRKVLEGPPLVSGDDLIGMGLTPGPHFGEILDAVEQARVSGEISDKESAYEFIRRYVGRT